MTSNEEKKYQKFTRSLVYSFVADHLPEMYRLSHIHMAGRKETDAEKLIQDLDFMIDEALHSQKERVVEMCEEMKRKPFDIQDPTTYKQYPERISEGYNQALSDLKTKIEEEL